MVVTGGKRDAPSGGHVIFIALFAMMIGVSGLFHVPPLDRDESRFIQATTQMIETGDYVRIRYQDTERNKKPVGIYWLQAASVNTLADVEDRPLWAYRMPSLVSAMLAAIFTYVAGCALFGRAPAFLAAMLLAAAPVVAGEASIAKTDAALLASICAMQAALAWIVTRRPGDGAKGTAIGFWIAVGAGTLIKGPIAPLIGLFTVIGLKVHGRLQGKPNTLLRDLRPVTGGLIMLAMVLPWLIAIGVMTEGRFFTEAIGRDMLGKVTSGQERHGGPIGYHVLALWVMFWPAALLLPSAIGRAVGSWRALPVFFCIAWVVPMWAVFEIASTKLPHYPMVLYPALALLIGAFVHWGSDASRPILRWAGAVMFTLVGVVAAVGVSYLAYSYSSDGVTPWHIFGSLVIATMTIVAAVFAIRGSRHRALAGAVLASGTVAWVAFEGVLPTLDRLALTPRLAQMLDDFEAHPLQDDSGPVALVGYHEPSAVFTLGTSTRLLRAEEAAVWIVAGPRRAAVVEDRERTAFLEALPADSDVEALAAIEGFNYSNNKDMRLVLYRVRARQ